MIAALCVVIFAGAMTFSPITGKNNQQAGKAAAETTNPFDMAEQAAMAGISAARGHIECHGIRQRGGLPRQFYVNGGSFEVTWGEVNLADSTVHVISVGYLESGLGAAYTSTLQSDLRVNLLPAHSQTILLHYYQEHANPH